MISAYLDVIAQECLSVAVDPVKHLQIKIKFKFLTLNLFLNPLIFQEFKNFSPTKIRPLESFKF